MNGYLVIDHKMAIINLKIAIINHKIAIVNPKIAIINHKIAIINHTIAIIIHTIAIPPKNGVIALWPNTRVVNCKYYVSQKRNGFNNKIHWYNILLTFIFKFTGAPQ